MPLFRRRSDQDLKMAITQPTNYNNQDDSYGDNACNDDNDEVNVIGQNLHEKTQDVYGFFFFNCVDKEIGSSKVFKAF